MRRDIEVDAARLAVKQHGAVARWQLLRLGFHRDVIRRRTKLWLELTPGVYRFPGSKPSWPQRLTARCLAWGPTAVACDRSAAALYKLKRFREGPIDVAVPRGRRPEARLGKAYPRTLRADEVTVVDGIPVTTPERTLQDLAGRVKPLAVEIALDDALRRKLVTIDGMRRHLDRARQKGNALLRSFLNERDGRKIVRSGFETELYRSMLDGGLDPTVGTEVTLPRVGTIEVDFAFVEERVVIEADSRKHHDDPEHFETDRARDAALTLAGYRFRRVTWKQFKTDPEGIIQSIKQLLDMARRMPAGQ